MSDTPPTPSTARRVVGAALAAGGLSYLAVEVFRDRGGDRTAHHLVPLLAALTGASLARPQSRRSATERARRRAAQRALDRVLAPWLDG
ncbi:hypothetical protein [Rubrivirga sp. IMCC45206]|uniref:hypothetical protein n=1 Tax=Rubrivirga sp. IMCC45206 TaxID=3391614 RepID=UPI00399015E6